MDPTERLAVITAEIRSLIRDVSQKIAASELQIEHAQRRQRQALADEDAAAADFGHRLEDDGRSELEIVKAVRERLIAMLPDE